MLKRLSISQFQRRPLAVCLCIVVFGGPLGAQITLEQVRDRVKNLQSRMVGRRCEPAGTNCFLSESAAIGALLRDYTVWKLNESGGNTIELVSDLRTVEDAFAFEVAGRKPESWEDRAPFAFRDTLPAGELVVTLNHFASGGLAIPEGIVVIQGFRKEGGQYVFGAGTGDSLFGVMDEKPIEMLKSPVPNEMWLLVSGQVAGFMGYLGRARIYSFDGYGFKELWKPDDRERVKITVKDREVRSTFLGPRMYRFGGDIRNCMDETVKLAPTGIVQAKVINNGECGDPDIQR
jgi:hypothetical protein